MISFKDAADNVEPILHRYFDEEDRASWPEALAQAIETSEGRIALGLCLVFLDKLLLADTSIPVASFELQSSDSSSIVATPTNMIIDAQAIEHLDILP